MPVKVTIVEDDARVRESLAILIDGAAGFRCISSHATAELALHQIPLVNPDVVLMDIHLPGISGIECVRRLKTAHPHLLVVMLTAYEDDDLIFQALAAGASGYLVKQTPPAELLAAIAEVRQGGGPMSSNIARKVIQSFHETGRPNSGTENLSSREREILKYLTKGYLYKEIAKELDISFETVHGHIKSIYSKFHVRSRTEAVAQYLRA